MLTTIKRLVPPAAKERLRPLRSVMSSTLNAGHAVECPVCAGTFRRFLPYQGRSGARCPRCRALERQRRLMLYLWRQTDLFSGAHKRMLHVAPERYLQSYFRQIPSIDYLSGDIASSLAMIRLDVTALGFRDASFDVVLCSHVLEHVSDDRAAMRELFRVMKPGGWGIIDVPIDPAREDTFEDWSVTEPADRERLFGQWNHVRIHGRNYPDLLRTAGFEVNVDEYEFTPEEVIRFGLRATDHLWLCRKTA